MNKDQMDKYTNFAKNKLGFAFKDINSLITAMTHRSYVNEHPKSAKDNERLEFLGDAILEYVVTDIMFSNYDADEGIMTKWRAAVVKTESNAEYGFNLGLNDLIRVSRGEKHASARAQEAIVADAFEALIGAIHADQGFEAAKDLIAKMIGPKLDNVIETGSWRDAKTVLQEITQNEVGQTPKYKLIGTTGPDHDRSFEMAVLVDGVQMGAGTGSSKQAAETMAAAEALEKYRAKKTKK